MSVELLRYLYFTGFIIPEQNKLFCVGKVISDISW